MNIYTLKYMDKKVNDFYRSFDAGKPVKILNKRHNSIDDMEVLEF